MSSSSEYLPTSDAERPSAVEFVTWSAATIAHKNAQRERMCGSTLALFKAPQNALTERHDSVTERHTKYRVTRCAYLTYGYIRHNLTIIIHGCCFTSNADRRASGRPNKVTRVNASRVEKTKAACDRKNFP